MEFNPYYLTPDADGYYKNGDTVYTSYNGDYEVFAGGCTDGYEDTYYDDSVYSPQKNHHESGTQQDFTYKNCMIMPTCYATDDDGTNVPAGFIQLAQGIAKGNTEYADSMSYIISPPLENLTELYLALSCDVTPNDKRTVDFIIEYSRDNGATWSGSNDDDVYIKDQVTAKSGMTVNYEEDDEVFANEFNDMIAASNEGTILLRIKTLSFYAATTGQAVNIHYMKITADEGDTTTTSAISTAGIIEEPFFSVEDKTILSTNTENLYIYSTMGQLIGKGLEITVPESGIYIIKSNSNAVQKVFIK